MGLNFEICRTVTKSRVTCAYFLVHINTINGY